MYSKTTDKYFKINPTRHEYLGERYFRFDPDSEKVVQVCLTVGEVKKGKSNTFGIYLIGRMTFFSNYYAMNYAIECTKKEYDKHFNKVLFMLK